MISNVNFLRRTGLICTLFLLIGWENLHGQGIPPVPGSTSHNAQTPGIAAQLPSTSGEIDTAIARIETRLDGVRTRLSAQTAITSEAASLTATSDERTEQRRLLQQLLSVLDSEVRNLRRLKEIREINRIQTVEQNGWQGFSEQPPYPFVFVEQLRDTIAGQELEAQSFEMMRSIVETELAGSATRLNESVRLLRQAKDQLELLGAQNQRQQWLVVLAQLRNETNEAAVEAAEMRRQVALESLNGRRKYIEFLKHKLSIAESKMRFSKQDIDLVQSQINLRRESFQKELNEALAADVELRKSLDTLRENLRNGTAPPGPDANVLTLTELQGAVEAAQMRAETSDTKIEILRTFVSLADYIQGVWEDRIWVRNDHTLMELRSKREQYEQLLTNLNQWTKFAEAKLSASVAQAIRYSIKQGDPSMTPAGRQAAQDVQNTLEDRAAMFQRALSVLSIVEGQTRRLTSEIADRELRMSASGKARYVLDQIGTFFHRIWIAELYVAEDTVIADGQKISIPRSITVGKVIIALSIFVLGLLLARWINGITGRVATGLFRTDDRTAGLSAKAAATIVVAVTLLVAMASVRIPWTVFAFMGGALAIGVGFGAQTLINNFISGIILLFERSIRVGDIVEVEEQRGKIMNIGLRSSLIKRGDGVDMLVPNSRFLEKNVINWTFTDNLVRYVVPVSVAYGSPTARVSELIAQAAADHPLVLKDPPPQVLFEDFGDNALLFTLKFWIRLGPDVDGGIVRSDLRHRIYELFELEDIAIAFPQRDVHLDSDGPIEVKVINSSPEGNGL